MGTDSTDDWIENLPRKTRIRLRIREATPNRILIYWNNYRYPLLLLSLLSAVYVVGFTFMPSLVATPTEVVAWAESNSGFISLLLSALLVLLYFGQHRTQRKQEQIMERQEKWMETDYVADIFIESWSAKGDSFSIFLLNAGNGTAKRFRVRIKVWLGESAESAPFVDSSFYSVLEIDRCIEHSDISSSILWPKEGPQEFITDISFMANVDRFLDRQDELKRASFEKMTDKVASASGTPISVQLSLLYDDERGETIERTFWAGTFEVTEGYTFENAIGGADNIPIGPQKVEPETKSNS